MPSLWTLACQCSGEEIALDIYASRMCITKHTMPTSHRGVSRRGFNVIQDGAIFRGTEGLILRLDGILNTGEKQLNQRLK